MTTALAAKVSTLAERKATEALRRQRASDAVVQSLARYARDNGGRFAIFGSYASGTIRFDSDLDILLDFSADRTAEAWRFVEETCAQHDVSPDIHDARATKTAFVDRVLAQAIILS